MYDYPEKTTCVEVRRTTLTERLENEKSHLEHRLTEVNEALSVLKSDPKIQAIFDILQKVAR
jgi:hypothetical protein